MILAAIVVLIIAIAAWAYSLKRAATNALSWPLPADAAGPGAVKVTRANYVPHSDTEFISTVDIEALPSLRYIAVFASGDGRKQSIGTKFGNTLIASCLWQPATVSVVAVDGLGRLGPTRAFALSPKCQNPAPLPVAVPVMSWPPAADSAGPAAVTSASAKIMPKVGKTHPTVVTWKALPNTPYFITLVPPEGLAPIVGIFTGSATFSHTFTPTWAPKEVIIFPFSMELGHPGPSIIVAAH